MLRRYVSVFIGVLAVCVMVFGSAGSAYAGAGGGNDKDDKNDKRVKVIGDGTTAIAGTAVLPSQAQALLDKKNKLSDEYVLVGQGKVDRQTYKEHWRAFLKEVNAPDMEQVVAARGEAVTSEAVAAAAPTSKTLGVTQFPQQKSYWCGPGSANSILQYLNPTSHDGEAVSQSLLANANRKYLETDYWGQTPWSYGANSEFHPYPETLTYWMTGNYYGLYAPVGAPSLTTYKNNLKADIDAYYPMAGNTVEYANQAHFNSHPNNIDVYHWVAIRGYANSGDSTQYVDPAALASSLNWTNAQQYNSMNSSSMVSFMSARGYIW